MVSTRRTKRPSFGDASAAPLAPTTPSTRSKRPRAASASPDTAVATPARARQQRKGKNNKTRESSEKKEGEDGAEEEVNADDVRPATAADDATVERQHKGVSTGHTKEQPDVKGTEPQSTRASAGAEVGTAAEAEDEMNGATTQRTEEETEEQAEGDDAGDDNEVEVESNEEMDVDVDEDDDANQPRVRTSSADGEMEGEGGGDGQDGAEHDDEDSDDGDGVVDDDEYNFDVDKEPLAPPAASQLDDEDDDDNLRAKEVRQRTSHAADDEDDDGTTGASTKFGATLSALLHQPTAPLASPLLAAAPLLAIPRDPTAAADRALRLKQRARREWRERAHRPDVQYDEVERRLVRLATRGVVQLFNAVQQQRRTVRMQAASEGMDRAVVAGASKQAVEMSKEGFMQLIRTAPAVERAEEQKVIGREGGRGKGAEQEKSGGWSVLKDDYMLGGKLTDWDKQIDDSEEEEELEEAEEEMEVE